MTHCTGEHAVFIFDGKRGSTDRNALAVNDVNNVDIALFSNDSNQTRIELGGELTYQITTPRRQVFNFLGQLKVDDMTKIDQIQPGDFSSVANFTIAYL